MKSLLPLTFLVLVILGCSGVGREKEPQKPSVFDTDKKAALQKQILDKIGKFPKKWGSVEFSRWEKGFVTIYLNYKTMPDNMVEVELSSKIVAQATLDVLKANGYDPLKEMLGLNIHTQMPESGVTGSKNVRRFGSVRYDFSNDTLGFTPNK